MTEQNQSPQTDLNPAAQARRDAMLPQLLAEVRRVRRRRILIKSASAAAALLLMTGVLSLALLTPARSPQSASTSIAKSPDNATVPLPTSHSPRVKILTASPDVLDRLSIRAPSLVRVEYINTDQALTLLQAEGDRYGTIEIAGRVEFLLIAAK